MEVPLSSLHELSHNIDYTHHVSLGMASKRKLHCIQPIQENHLVHQENEVLTDKLAKRPSAKPCNNALHQPLTHENLSLLNQYNHCSPPLSLMPSSPSKRTVSSADAAKSIAILNIWRISIDGGESVMPTTVKLLLQRIADDPRNSNQITPNSKRLAAAQPTLRDLSEMDAASRMKDLLAYKDKLYEGDEQGIDMVYIGEGHQWSDCVPQPQDCKRDLLEQAMKNLGCPPKPKPDFAHGYPDFAFTRGTPSQNAKLTAQRDGLPISAYVRQQKPWWPWLVIEMKTQQPIAAARRQAARDAAAAIATFHRTLEYKTGSPPSPGSTAVFSLCVDAEIVELRVHWRHVDESSGEVFWQAHEIESGRLKYAGDVFRIRGKILAILQWASTARWRLLENALLNGVLSESAAANEEQDQVAIVDEQELQQEANKGNETTILSPPLTAGTTDTNKISGAKRHRVSSTVSQEEQSPTLDTVMECDIPESPSTLF